MQDQDAEEETLLGFGHKTASKAANGEMQESTLGYLVWDTY